LFPIIKWLVFQHFPTIQSSQPVRYQHLHGDQNRWGPWPIAGKL
jgi:hypothetical protein